MHIHQYGARTVIGCTDKNDQTVLHYAAHVGNVLVRITIIDCLFYTLFVSLFNSSVSITVCRIESSKTFTWLVCIAAFDLPDL